MRESRPAAAPVADQAVVVRDFKRAWEAKDIAALIGLLDPTVDLENAMLAYTRGFTVELILLPFGLAAVASRLRPETA